jgi:hypothetical protein
MAVSCRTLPCRHSCNSLDKLIEAFGEQAVDQRLWLALLTD